MIHYFGQSRIGETDHQCKWAFSKNESCTIVHYFAFLNCWYLTCRRCFVRAQWMEGHKYQTHTTTCSGALDSYRYTLRIRCKTRIFISTLMSDSKPFLFSEVNIAPLCKPLIYRSNKGNFQTQFGLHCAKRVKNQKTKWKKIKHRKFDALKIPNCKIFFSCCWRKTIAAIRITVWYHFLIFR